MLKITYNSDKQLVDEILDKLDKNDGYCPCKLEKSKDTKCMCAEFRQQDEGFCHCGLFFKENT